MRTARQKIADWQADRDRFARLALVRDAIAECDPDKPKYMRLVEDRRRLELALGLTPTKVFGVTGDDPRMLGKRVPLTERIERGLCLRCGLEPLETKTSGRNCLKKTRVYREDEDD